MTPDRQPDTAACGDHKVFPRDTFARTRRAEVWCDKPKGHDGEHQAVKGSTAFVWEDPMASDSAATYDTLRDYAADVLRRHTPRPTEGTFSACVWCGHTWMSDGPLGGCDEFYKAARALGCTTDEEARRVR